jgi:hypothetical protein
MTNYKSYTIHNQQYKWAVHYKGKCIPFKYDPNKMPDDIVEGMADDEVFADHQNVFDGDKSIYKDIKDCFYK